MPPVPPAAPVPVALKWCRFRDYILESSKLWKTGALREPPKVISDIMHGAVARKSVLTAPSEEENLLRIGWIFGYDDLEILNGLSVGRGNKKLACFYLALTNLPAPVRFEHENICILMLVLQKVLKRCGAVRVVAGASGVTGEIDPNDWASFGAQVRASLAGETELKVKRHRQPRCQPRRQPPRQPRHQPRRQPRASLTASLAASLPTSLAACAMSRCGCVCHTGEQC